MNTFFANALRQLREFFAKLSRREKMRLGILAVLIVAFSISLALILGRVNYAVLYSNLTTAEAGEILTTLTDMGVVVKTPNDNTILVPADRVGELRMLLEAEGYNGGDFSTSLLERAMGFGNTAQDRETFDRLQTQSNLRRSIMRMEKIEDCLVLLTLQKESMFALNTNTTPSTASVILVVKDGGALSPTEALSVGNIVARAVPGLSLENISIVDSKMNTYSLNADDALGTGSTSIDYQVALREQIRKSLETQVINFLTPVFGEGHVRASVNVTLNFDKEMVSSVEFAPPVEDETEGLVISMKELYENTREGNAAQGVPGTDTNGLGVVEYPYGTLGEDEYYSKVLREINYEIDETRTQIERAQGTIRSLSIAVLLDSEAISEDYTENVRELVAQALGVGDRYISVQRLPFLVSGQATDAAWQAQRDFERAMQYRELIKTAIIALTIILLAFFAFSFLRTLARSLAPQRPVLAMAGGGPGGTVNYLSTEDGLLQDLEQLGQGESPDKIVSVKSEAVEQLEKFIDRDPQSVAQLLRNWLGDDYR